MPRLGPAPQLQAHLLHVAQVVLALGDGGVRHQYDVAVREFEQPLVGRRRLPVADIEREAAEPAALQRLDQRRVIDELGARDIDEERARLRALSCARPTRPRVEALSGSAGVMKSALAITSSSVA